MSVTEKITLNLNDLAKGRVELNSFKQTVESFDFSPYKDKYVQLKGCAPTWAHLLVAGKLFPITTGIDFVIDDGAEGKPIQIR